MKNLPKQIRLLPTLILIVVFIVVGISACNNIFGGGEEEAPPGPETFDILAPPNDVRAIVGSPIQIQSAHPNSGNLSRVELYVQRENEPTEQLIRSDTPDNGVAVQQWVPREVGLYTIKVRGIQSSNGTPATPSEYTRQIRVIDNAVSGVAVAEVGQPPTQVEPTVVAATPAPTEAEQTDAGAAFVVDAAVVPEPTPTPIPRYPPPPPSPGVPWGPTQAELPNFHPPVCDAAEFLAIFEPDRGLRVSVTEPDDVAAKAAAGTTIHRAWRLRNIGTCTWGPGYELAFYGGRTMGSGGVAFESSYPSDVPRRNALIDNTRLIVPEGKPNQTAVLEVLLNVPTVPGIHQSYWRMRNPHGVYFGPILGVTLEVVRECQPEDRTERIYGAPVINRFIILGVGDVYEPVDPRRVIAELGEQITLEWNVINANNFDIVFEDPTGDLETLSTNDTNSRASFTPTTLGEHRITLFADNGTCTLEAQVIVVVEPPDEEQFRLDIILASSTQVSSADASVSFSPELPENRTRLEWQHFDPEADQFFLIARGERMVAEDYCVPFTDMCYPVFGDWQETGEIRLDLGGGGVNTATVANVEQRLCPASFNPELADHRIIYQLQAFKDGRAADPEFSNEIEVFCSPSSSDLPREIR